MTFGDRLRRLRKQRDMTQEVIAKKLNIVRSTYAYYETGKTYPDFDTVIRISRLFSVSTDYLLGASDTPRPVLRDETTSTYAANVPAQLGYEWNLRESEQRLITAFRYLDVSTQAGILEEIEKSATALYEMRHRNKAKKKEE